MGLTTQLFRMTGSFVVITTSFFSIDYFRRCRRFDDKVGRVNRILDGRLGRPLEALEAYFENTQLRGTGLISIAFFLESLAPLKAEDLTRALSRVAAANPMLRLRIDDLAEANKENEKEDGLLFFVEMDKFRPNFEVLDTDDWKGVVEKDITKPIDSRFGPLWRVKLLRGSVELGKHKQVLVCTFHHGIVDGKSIMAFGDQLVEKLSDNVEDDQSAVVKTLPPSNKELLGENLMKLSALTKIKIYLFYKLGEAFNIKSHEPSCSLAVLTSRPKMKMPFLPNATRVIPLQLTAEQLDQLLRRCRHHQCKLHATLQAVVSLAELRMLKENMTKDGGSDFPASLKISNTYAMSTRGFANPPLTDETIGVYAQGPRMTRDVESDLETQGQKFWSFARSMNEEIHGIANEKSVTDFLKITDFLYPLFPDFFSKMSLKNELSLDYFMTNYGSFFTARNERRPVDITAAYSTLNVAWSGLCFAHVILSIHGGLFWTISFSERSISEEQGRAYAQCIVDTLREVVNG